MEPDDQLPRIDPVASSTRPLQFRCWAEMRQLKSTCGDILQLGYRSELAAMVYDFGDYMKNFSRIVLMFVVSTAACGADPVDGGPDGPDEQVVSGNRGAESVNPYSPAYGHPYRHGVVPTPETQATITAWRTAKALAVTSAQTLRFGGGLNGAGVTSGTPRVYLIFYGNQWGAPGSDVSGNLTLSADTSSVAPYLQKMFRGLGTNGELWSGVMTQYCDGPLVTTGATSCPDAAPHIGYPSEATLAGVWYDNSIPSPAQATFDQLATEAINAAAHFGNTTAISNRYAQYVVISPTGTHPDQFGLPNQGFCAWHNFTTSSFGNLAFTNLPYVNDITCGMNFVNAGPQGVLDGFSIVEGHEYAETLTDQFVNNTGWSNSGQENADECAWIRSGPGALANVAMATGTFAMQSTWSNDTDRCDISHSIVAAPPMPVLEFTNNGATKHSRFQFNATGGGSFPYVCQGTSPGGGIGRTFILEEYLDGALYSTTQATGASNNPMCTIDRTESSAGGWPGTWELKLKYTSGTSVPLQYTQINSVSSVQYACNPGRNLRIYGAYSGQFVDNYYTYDRWMLNLAISYGYNYTGSPFSMELYANNRTSVFERYYKDPPQTDHFMTSIPSEQAFVLGFGYVDDGFVGNVYSARVPGSVPMYRYSFYDGSTGDLSHYYSIVPSPPPISLGFYTYDGVMAYVCP